MAFSPLKYTPLLCNCHSFTLERLTKPVFGDGLPTAPFGLTARSPSFGSTGRPSVENSAGSGDPRTTAAACCRPAALSGRFFNGLLTLLRGRIQKLLHFRTDLFARR